MYRRRKTVLVLWLVVFAVFAWWAPKAPGMLNDNGFTPYGSESEAGKRILRDDLGAASSLFHLVYESDRLDLTADPEKRRIIDSLSELQKRPGVGSISFHAAPRLEDGRNVQAVLVPLDLETDESLKQFPEIRGMIQPPSGMKVYVTGEAPVLYDLQNASKHDIMRAEMIGLPIALVVLLLIFGTVPGALLPLIAGIASVTVTLGMTYFIARDVSLSSFLPNMVTMLGLAVGIDYALFMVSRFREELKAGRDVETAVSATCQTAGKAIFFSGIAVLIGLLGMLLIDFNIFRSLCLGGVMVVFVSVTAGNTLLPALLGMFGHKVNALRIMPAAWRDKRASRLWENVAYFVMNKPLLLVLVMSAILFAMMLPLLQMKLGVSDADVIPPSYESRFGSDLLDRTYDQREMSPVQIAVQSDEPVWDERTVRQVQSFTAELGKLPQVERIVSYADLLPPESPAQASDPLARSSWRQQVEARKLAADHTAVVTVIPRSDPDSKAVSRLVERIRQLDAGDLRVSVTGAAAYRLDIVNRIHSQIPAVILFVVGATYLVLLFAFRSVVLPLKAVLMNMMSLGASLGAVVSVFQFGRGAELFQVTSTGYVNAILPMIVFCVVFGISMDYEVFLISRIMEEYEAGGDNQASTAAGLKRTGGLITGAASILVVVVGTFIFTDLEIMKALGLGLALAVFLDATLIRIIIVPALMKLMGRVNWWAPAWLKPLRRPQP